MKAMARTKSEDLNKQMKSSKDPQGMYILGPDGQSYGFTNDHYPDDIQKFINACKARYKASPPKQVTFSQEELSSQFSRRPPEGAQVVRVYARIWPLPEKCWGLNRGVGRDFLWVYADERKKLLAAKPNPSGQISVPNSLTTRIARFHLLDDVRGTPDMWAAGNVLQNSVSAQLVRDSPEFRTLKWSQTFRLKTGSGGRGFEGTLQGEMDVNRADGRMVRFRAYADGKAWGRGTYTPFPPEGKYGLHIGFREADTKDEAAQVVPPEEVSTANNDMEYRNPSVVIVKQGGKRKQMAK